MCLTKVFGVLLLKKGYWGRDQPTGGGQQEYSFPRAAIANHIDWVT